MKKRKQAEKLKSPEMKDEVWKMNDEGWTMKEECWKMKDWGWRGFWGRMNGWTDGHLWL